MLVEAPRQEVAPESNSAGSAAIGATAEIPIPIIRALVGPAIARRGGTDTLQKAFAGGAQGGTNGGGAGLKAQEHPAGFLGGDVAGAGAGGAFAGKEPDADMALGGKKGVGVGVRAGEAITGSDQGDGLAGAFGGDWAMKEQGGAQGVNGLGEAVRVCISHDN